MPTLRTAKKRLSTELQKFQLKRPDRLATITDVTRDAYGRAVSAQANIDGMSVPVPCHYGARIYEGETWTAVNTGRPTAPQWELVRKYQASPYDPASGQNVQLPTILGFQVTDYAYHLAPDGAATVDLLAWWLKLSHPWGAMHYDVQVCTDDLSMQPVSRTVYITSAIALLPENITNSQSFIPRGTSTFAGTEQAPNLSDVTVFPPRGRIQIEAEQIDYTGVTSGVWGLGTGVGTLNNFALDEDVLDTFSGATQYLSVHTPDVDDSGAGWSYPGGTEYWQASGNVARPTGTPSAWPWHMEYIDAQKANHVITCKLSLADSTSNAGLITRFQDSNNMWLVEVSSTDSELRISEVVSGTPTEKASIAVSLTAGEWYDLLVRSTGTEIEAILQGGDLDANSTVAVKYTSASSYQTETEVGIYSQETGNWFDNFRVRDYHAFTTFDCNVAWPEDYFEGFVLVDSGGTQFEITASDDGDLTVSGTPASGAFEIWPAFTGCTRGVAGTSPATHSASDYIYALSAHIIIDGLVTGQTYNCRVRPRNAEGAIGYWTSFYSIEASATEYPRGQNLLSNADFTYDVDGDGDPDDWFMAYNESYNAMEHGAYGMYGGQGLRASGGPTGPSGGTCSATWRCDVSGIQTRAIVGQTYQASIYVQEVNQSNPVYYGCKEDYPDGVVISCLMLFTDSAGTGVNVPVKCPLATAYVLGDGWKRIVWKHLVTDEDIASSRHFIGFTLTVFFNESMGGTSYLYFDRPQLEMSPRLTEWMPGIIQQGGGSPSGLAFDTVGLKDASGNAYLSADGKWYSNMLPSGTTRTLGTQSDPWGGIFIDGDARHSGGLVVGSIATDPPTGAFVLTDGITAPSQIASFAILYVDTADSHLKIKHGGGATTDLEAGGGTHALDAGQTDVVITSPADNEVLAYDLGSTNWINQTPAEAGLSAYGHNIVGADHAVTGSQWQLIGLTGTDTLGLLTPSADPGAAVAILRTDASGYLDLEKLVTTTLEFPSGANRYLELNDGSASRTLYMRNTDGTYLLHLDVEGNITLGGTLDGVDLATFKSGYDTHVADEDAHHNRQHGIVSSSEHTGSGSALDVVGFSATNTLGVLAPSSNPGAAASLLKTTASGFLTLVTLILTGSLTTSDISTSNSNLDLDAFHTGSDTIVYVRNSDAGYKADLNVEGDVVVGGLVDGVDLATFKSGYDTHAADGDAHHNEDHASTHEDGGGDVIDGDHLEITWVPTNYTRSTTPTEADSLDDLTAHLYGIDVALASAGAHDIVGASHTVTGSQWQLIGLTGTDTLGLLTPSASPGAAEAILKTTAAGALTLGGTLTVSGGDAALGQVGVSRYSALFDHSEGDIIYRLNTLQIVLFDGSTGDITLGDLGSSLFNLYYDWSEGDLSFRRQTTVLMDFDGGLGDITLGWVAASHGNILYDYSEGDLKLRINTTDYLTLDGGAGTLTANQGLTVTTAVSTPELTNAGNITIDAVNASAASVITLENSDASYKTGLEVAGTGIFTDGIRIGTAAAPAAGCLIIYSNGDPRVIWNHSTGTDWVAGSDASNSNYWCLNSGTSSISTTSDIVMAPGGLMALEGGLHVGTAGAVGSVQAGYVQATVGMSGWLPFCNYGSLGYNISTTNTPVFSCTLSRNATLRSWHQGVYVNGTNNGSNYWTLTLKKNVDDSTITSLNTSAISGSTQAVLSTTGLSTSLSSSDLGYYIVVTKTGSPGNLSVHGPAVFVT